MSRVIDSREQEIADLIVEVAEPQARRVMRRWARYDSVTPEDADDIVATVTMRLVSRLRDGSWSGDEAIRDFDSYVARLTLNALNDHFRRRFPQRTRLKNRLRYALTRDPRLALWSIGDVLVCGLAQWQGAKPESVPPHLHALPLRRQEGPPASALVQLFEASEVPLAFEKLVDLLAELWHVVDVPAPERDVRPPADMSLEWKELLTKLWAEAGQLRPMQRRALLLNLRDPEAAHVLSLFMLTGIATFDEIATALEMTPEELAKIWNDLPFDDNRIADLLGITRQQVINLRKSARERLTRRLSYKRPGDE